MAKSKTAFHTIGEVESALGIAQHKLRYWEDQIAAIQPLRRGRKSRLYRPQDLDLLAGVKHLVDKGQTLQAVRNTIAEKGIDHVASLGTVDRGASLSERNRKSADNQASRPSNEGAVQASDDSTDGKAQIDLDALGQVYSRLQKLRQRIDAASQ
ncbi:MAG: MerR family transcriptional regulator [Rhodobacteraceae bacterium]|nr:MerR family transcriptional regulator [Paracoccaceae bacterium]MCY4195332.1 MerR family transcriptional regulator [Paracoccaceae bacterium]